MLAVLDALTLAGLTLLFVVGIAGVLTATFGRSSEYVPRHRRPS